jgi:hypothetical protein
MKTRGNWKLLPIGALALSLFTGCAKEHFEKLNYTAKASAGQYSYVNPKLDVVIFQDNSGSMRQPNDIVKPQLQAFLSGIQASWDFRFIVVPLQSTASVGGKVMVAKDCSGLGSFQCLSPSQIGTFNSIGGDGAWINSIDSGTGNVDNGFLSMTYNINSLISGGFLRQDAVFAAVVVTNGEDVSGGVAYDSNGRIDYTSSTMVYSFNQYKNWFLSMKAAQPLTRFYSVAAAARYQNCYGGLAFEGKRYRDMASALGGMAYDLCSGQLNNALVDISSRMQTVVQVIAFDYIVLPEKPSTINSVIKNNVALPANQWKYVGYKENQPTSYSPAPGNIRSGYMIQLIGTDYRGNDTIDVDFKK